jgi:hypothetical protein
MMREDCWHCRCPYRLYVSCPECGPLEAVGRGRSSSSCLRPHLSGGPLPSFPRECRRVREPSRNPWDRDTVRGDAETKDHRPSMLAEAFLATTSVQVDGHTLVDDAEDVTHQFENSFAAGRSELGV